MTADEVGRLLLVEARRADVQFGAMMNWYVAERFTQRLEQSGHRANLLLYGDLILHALEPAGVPRVWTAELVRRAGLDAKDLAGALADVASVDGSDGLVFEPAAELRQASSRGEPCMVEARVTARLGESVCPIRVRISEDPVPEVEPSDLRFPPTLNETDPSRPMACAPEVLLADLVYQLARSGVTHLRPKSYLDLRRLLRFKDFRPAVAVRAIASRFNGAESPMRIPLAFGPEAAADKTLKQMWTAYCLRARIPALDLSPVIEDLRFRLQPLMREGRRSS
ncbi:MAG: hypothetical protein U1E89_06775 [Burkholderiaceae bacterium]